MICGVQRTVIDNRYEISRELGGGGMARVYLAHDAVLGRDVALKILRDQFAEDAEFAERFKREAQSAASLTHPNIVSVYDRGESEDGTAYIAMEHVGGGTLKEHITREGALAPEEASRLALQVAEALGLAHRRGVIHRDIKPHNVLLTEPHGAQADASADAKVTDFGIARAAASTTISQTSRVMGTASYMSPEQALGESLDHRTDLYSLGVVLYEMLTGELPHTAESPVAVSLKHVNDTPRPPREANPDVPRDLEAITMKLLEKAPDDRYRSAPELAHDLRRVRDGLPPAIADAGAAMTQPQPTRAFKRHAPTPPARGRRNGMLRGVFALALVLLVLLGGWALSQSFQDFGFQNVLGGAPSGAEVPNVKGDSQAQAQRELEAAGLKAKIREQESSAAQDGTVLRQTPAAGDRAGKGSVVTLTVGSGPALVEVPDLFRMSGGEAKAALERAGLGVGSVRELSSAIVPAGEVLEQGVAAGTSVPRGTDVDVGVSTGPAPVSVPEATPTPESVPEDNSQRGPGQEDAADREAVPDQSTASPRPSTEPPVPEQRRGANSGPGPSFEEPAKKIKPEKEKSGKGIGVEIEGDGSGISGSGEEN